MVVIKSPGTYMQAPGILHDIGVHLKPLGNNFLFLCRQGRWNKVNEPIIESMAREKITWEYEEFENECCYPAMEKAASRLKAGRFDGLVAIGGGKACDTGKGAAYRGGVKSIIIPTTAASDAPCSGSAVVFSPEGVPDSIERYPSNPALVLVDSQIIANAPVIYLISGMGDAVATFFEARIHHDYQILTQRGFAASLTSYSLAEACYKILMRYGRGAISAVQSHTVDESLEMVIEANIFLSCFGFENGGLSLAHGVQEALSLIPECSKQLHGMRVGFGTLCLLVLEDRDQAEIEETFAFCADVGLPVTLDELGLADDAERKMRQTLTHAMPPGHPVYVMPPGKTIEDLVQAVMKADSIGRNLKKQH